LGVTRRASGGPFKATAASTGTGEHAEGRVAGSPAATAPGDDDPVTQTVTVLADIAGAATSTAATGGHTTTVVTSRPVTALTTHIHEQRLSRGDREHRTDPAAETATCPPCATRGAGRIDRNTVDPGRDRPGLGGPGIREGG
jgi:hypothetical protein